ncbi:MAG: xanthine dehydrogenase [Rhizobiales bacterium NRL2]|jgi:CO/xanthine dehydrogenase FAD-binding subunit|nr:MAG: xanthine dehydrogenase [Rhizobiales bacterium NRL2]
MPEFVRPAGLEEALERLSGGVWTVLAGGTDFYPARVGRAVSESVMDVTAIRGLRGIETTAEGFRIGALTTWTDILRADLPPAFDALKLAAREVGSVQVQNAGTVAGNLCNASPAADGVPPLLILDAEVELASAAGRRRMPLAEFIHGNRRTARRADELLVAVHVPRQAATGRSTFLKLGARRYLVISIVMVAARLARNGDDLTDAAISVGACSEVAQRLPALERDMLVRTLPGDWPTPVHLEALSPIDDVRADAPYRRIAAAEAVRRAVACLGGSA